MDLLLHKEVVWKLIENPGEWNCVMNVNSRCKTQSSAQDRFWIEVSANIWKVVAMCIKGVC